MQEQSADDVLSHASHRRRTLLLIVAVISGALLLAYLVAVLTTVGGVPDNTVVAGVEIGGQSQHQAAASLEAGLADTAAAPITVAAVDSQTTFLPTVVGLKPDYAATADIASGPIFDPVRLFKIVTGQAVEVAPVVTYDEDLMQQGLAQFGETADTPATEPQIQMHPTQPTLDRGAAGRAVDKQAAPGVIASAYLLTTGPIALPEVAVEQTVSDEEAQRVLDEYAVPAVGGPVHVTSEASSDELGVTAIAAALSFHPAAGSLEPQLNVATVRSELPELAAAADPGTDATWDVSSGTPVVVPSKDGQGVADEELTSQLLAVLPEVDPADREVALRFVALPPSLTTEQAQALNITEQMSEFTQKFDYAEYREVNVGQAAKYMNGKVLKPGEVYSMNDTIHERTEANGYVEGTYISNGKFEQGLGGGVSIATTATWTAAFFAGLEAVEVNPHTLYISRYQPGLEATVAWGQLDLKFRNDSGNGVLITTAAGDTFITVTMWGTKHYEDVNDVSSERYNVTPYPTKTDTAAGCTPQGGVNGFTIDVWRVFIKNGVEFNREKFTTRYDPTTQYVCAAPPAPPPPTPAPSAPAATL